MRRAKRIIQGHGPSNRWTTHPNITIANFITLFRVSEMSIPNEALQKVRGRL